MIKQNKHSVDSSYGTEITLEDQIVKLLDIEQSIDLRLFINWKPGSEIQSTKEFYEQKVVFFLYVPL